MKSSSRSLKFLGLFLFLILVVLGQQCSKVNLEENKMFGFSKTSNNPYLLPSPDLFPSLRRFIFFIDMSHSMISGLCIQDVDSDMYDPNKKYEIYDPNKKIGSLSDHRPSGVDCKVDPNRPFDTNLDSRPIDLGLEPLNFLLTHPGIDYQRDRIAVLQQWIQNFRNELLKPEDSIQVMIVPFSGGQSQKNLNLKMSQFLGKSGAIQFMDINDTKIDLLIQWMKEEHDFNYTLAMSDDPWRYEERSMGTSNPGTLYRELYDYLQRDMRSLNNKGLLFYTNYQWIHITDGILTPIQNHIKNVLSSYAPCSTCMNNPKSCTGVCGSLTNKMIQAWGDPEYQEPKLMDFYFGLMDSLPVYFGAGSLQADFVSVQPSRKAMTRPSPLPFWKTLEPYFKLRGQKPLEWSLEKSISDLRLADSNNGKINYQITHFFLFNSNVLVNELNKIESDSDGDGLSDSREFHIGTQVNNSRTNGYCLDSFLASPAFGERCIAMAGSRSCDPKLDSDGDSLNECEESLLGTSPLDFDTDGDSMPDFLEWRLGYNPLAPDADLDMMGDGILNSSKFSSGLGPNSVYGKIPREFLTQYAINEIGKKPMIDSFGSTVYIVLKQLLLINFPYALGTESLSQQSNLSISRNTSGFDNDLFNLIPPNDQLLSPIEKVNHNTLMALARVIDIDNPNKIYWYIYKKSIPVPVELTQPQLNLSDFKLIRTKDQGGRGGE